MSDDDHDVGRAAAEPGSRRRPIEPDQFAQLMGAIKDSKQEFQSQLCAFKEEIRQGQEEAATKALKRARHEKPNQYQKKGNE